MESQVFSSYGNPRSRREDEGGRYEDVKAEEVQPEHHRPSRLGY